MMDMSNSAPPAAGRIASLCRAAASRKWRQCTPRTPGSYKRAHRSTVRWKPPRFGVRPDRAVFRLRLRSVTRGAGPAPPQLSERGRDVHFLNDGAALVDDLQLDGATAAGAGEAAGGGELRVGRDLEL